MVGVSVLPWLCAVPVAMPSPFPSGVRAVSVSVSAVPAWRFFRGGLLNGRLCYHAATPAQKIGFFRAFPAVAVCLVGGGASRAFLGRFWGLFWLSVAVIP